MEMDDKVTYSRRCPLGRRLQRDPLASHMLGAKQGKKYIIDILPADLYSKCMTFGPDRGNMACIWQTARASQAAFLPVGVGLLSEG
jgi:hypothetical protein